MREIRLPAEWEEHEATWLSWPNPRGDSFRGQEILDSVLPTFFEIARAIARSERVLINVSDPDEVALITAGLGDTAEIFGVPTNEPWCRDHGPLIVREGDARVATCWEFNAWGQKYEPYDLDAAAAVGMADQAGLQSRDCPLVLEGGMIDSNGSGTALVARRSLLDPRRNPGLTEAQAVEILRDELGIYRPIWLDEQVAGDDTDGHVDVYARFVAEDKIVVCHEGDAAQVVAASLPECEIVEIPPPPPLESDGQRLPAGYANFYLTNGSVLLPSFAVEQDECARQTLAGCFPGREVVEVDCRKLVWGLGSIHCLTQPLFARGA